MRPFLLAAVAASLAIGAPKPFDNEIRGEFTFAANRDFKPEEVARGGRAVLPLLSNIDSFNPYLSTSVDADEVHGLLYPLPLKERPDYYKGRSTYAPGLVDRWEVEGKTIRMHIRDEANWSDGVPVTSADVVFSHAAAKDPDIAWPNSSILDWIERVEAVDAKNYVLHYTMAYPDMLMDSKDWRILPKHVFGKVPFKEWKNVTNWDEFASVVSGPYRVESYKSNQEFVLVPNAKHWDPALPRLSRLIFRVISSQTTQFQALQTGEIDFMQGIKPKDFRTLKDRKDLLLYSFRSRAYGYIGWNSEKPWFRDPEVRRALTLGIDRENIIDSSFYGYAVLTASPIITSMWACDRSLEPHPYDPEEAARILDAAGWTRDGDGPRRKDGVEFAFSLSWNAGNEIRQKIAELVQANLRDLGIRVTLRPVDFNTWSENLQEGKEEAWVAGWYVATKVDEKPTFHSSSIPGFNYSRWRNAEIDRIIDAGRVEPDEAKARALWKEFQAIFHREQPMTILYEPMALNALHRRFRNVEINALDVYDNLHEWFIPAAEQD